jgi:predicted nuclease of predicted toxin-antitoxin system
MSTPDLKFLVDVGVGKKVEDFLYKSGYDVLPVRKINPRMSDSEIIGIAAKDNRIIITMDKDFGELVYNSDMIHKGILLLRTENCSGDKKAKILSEILIKYSSELEDNFCVFSKDRLRIRRKRK